jgi:hypothetical protein
MTSKKLEKFIEKLNTHKLKSARKFPAISEVRKNKSFQLKVKNIYQLKDTLKNTYLIVVKNYKKEPKIRYFLAHSLASVSSDLLVYLARDFAREHNLKLIQYSLYPKLLRLNLLCLKELTDSEKYMNIIKLFKEFDLVLERRLKNLKKLII